MHNNTPASSSVSAERASFLKKKKKNRVLIRCLRISILIGFLCFWEFSGRVGLCDPFIFSMPSRIAETLWSLFTSGELFMHIGTSCLEALIGFSAGTLLGILLAMLLWWSENAYRIFEPYLVILSALPKVALGPVFIVWVGAGTGAIIVMTLAISLIVTTLDVLSGFVNTDADKIKLLKTFGADRNQIFFNVVIPYNLPTIANALKVNAGLTWIGVIMGEFLVSKAGIGYLIVYGSQVFRMDLVMSGVIILAAAAAVMYELISLPEKHLLKSINNNNK